MNFTLAALIALIILCGFEIFTGIRRKSKFLVIIGAIFAAVLVLCLILFLKYSSALYIPGPGKIL